MLHERRSSAAGLATVVVALLAALQTSSPAVAALSLAPVFSDHVVLQRDALVPVEGRASPGERVVVRFGEGTAEGTADAAGRFAVRIASGSASTAPRDLVVETSGGERIVVRDVLVGDVWLCGGQSNMEWPVALTMHVKEAESAARSTIRALKMPHVLAEGPIESADVRWRVATPENVLRTTAVGFFFADELARSIEPGKEIPIGLLDINWGGTRIEPWMAGGQMFHAMIAPIAPFPIRGAIWYQGESNAQEAEKYADQLRTLIADWRAAFDHKGMPFGVVQLASFMALSDDPVEGGWSALRDAQLAAVRATPGAGLVTTLDVGDAEDIHPRDKRTVGRRLASWALGTTYGREVAAIGPPTAVAFERLESADGRRGIRVRFEHAKGLAPRDGDVVRGLSLAGKDGRHVWAEGRVDGASVVVTSADVADPVEVAYAWQNNPVRANLVNGAGWPAAPFRGRVE
jgi:sialate O-acetylesterase